MAKSIWKAIEEDDYVAYDALVKIVKDTLAKDDNKKAFQVEDSFNAYFVGMMEKLEKEFA